MSVKIIFPPFAEHVLSGPFISPYLLASILEKEGIYAVAIDLNILFIRKLLNPVIIQRILTENLVSAHDAKVLTHFCSIPLSDYIQYSNDGLVYVLQILRKIIIPESVDFDSCLSYKPKNKSIVSDIYSELIADLKLKKIDIIGFSIPFAEQLSETLFIAKTIKKLHPEIKIIAGGSQVNLLDENQLKNLLNTKIFTVIAKGDGEAGIVDLIKNINNYNDSILIQFPLVNQKILDEVPYLVYNETSQYFGKLILPVLATKGCYWGKCSFCDYIKLSNISDKKYIARKPESVLNEINKLEAENKTATFFLISDAVPPVWYKNLCKLAIDTGTQLKTWSYLIHSEIYDRAFFELLSSAGVKAITFGTESLDNRLLNILQKNFTKEIIHKNLLDSSALKFSVTVNIIPDVPSATDEESQKVYLEIQALSSLYDVLNIQPFVLTADTAMAKYPESFGIEISDFVGKKTVHGLHSLTYLDLHGMTDEERKKTLQAFHEYSAKIKINKRVKRIMQNQIQDETILYLDPTVFVINNEHPELFIGSLKTGFTIKKWEIDFFSKLILFQNNSLLFSEIRKLFCMHSSQDSTVFLKYFLTILKRGVFVKSV